MSTKTRSTDWEKALNAWKNGDKNEFLRICMPAAEIYAAKKADEFRRRNSRFNMHLDDHACLATAMRALVQISNMKPYEGLTAEGLQHLCGKTMYRRMCDTQRKGMTNKNRMYEKSLNETNEDGFEPMELIPARQDKNTSMEEVRQTLLDRIRPYLNEEQHRVMTAFLTMEPEGSTHKEIASHLEMELRDFERILNSAKHQLRRKAQHALMSEFGMLGGSTASQRA